MGDEEHAGAAAALHVLDQFQDLRLRRDVERGRRLVGDQERRIEDQRGRDHHALALPAGDLMRIGGVHPLRLGQAHRLQHRQHAAAPLGGAEIGVDAQNLLDLVADRQHRVQRRHRLLEDHRHPVAAQRPQPLRRRRQNILALQADRARDGLQRPGEQAHHREGGDGFARARFPDDADDLARADAERDVIDSEGAVAAAGQSDAQPRDLQDGSLSLAHRPAILGSRVSRRPSPSMLTASTVRPRKMPG